MSTTWITPAMGLVERAGQSALHGWLRQPEKTNWVHRLQDAIRTWKATIAETPVFAAGRREP